MTDQAEIASLGETEPHLGKGVGLRHVLPWLVLCRLVPERIDD